MFKEFGKEFILNVCDFEVEELEILCWFEIIFGFGNIVENVVDFVDFVIVVEVFCILD